MRADPPFNRPKVRQDIPVRNCPLVVTTVAQACMDAGADRVVVLDYPLYKTELCLQRSGIQEACKSIRGVYFLGLDDRKFFREIKVPRGKVLDRVEAMQEVLDSHVLINLPQAKSHSNTGVSLGIKNLMGLIWDWWSFHEAIRSLPLEEKTHAKVGTALLNRDLCLVWPQDKLCLICDEICPYHAIVFRTLEGYRRPVVVATNGEIRLKAGSYVEEAKKLQLDFTPNPSDDRFFLEQSGIKAEEKKAPEKGAVPRGTAAPKRPKGLL